MALLQRRSLFRKYVVSLVGLVAFVLAAISVVDIWITYRDTKAALLEAQAEKAAIAAKRIDQIVAGLERQISRATRASAISLDQRRAEYVSILGREPEIASLVQLDRAGTEQIRVSREGARLGGSEDWSRSDAFASRRQDRAWLGPVFAKGSGPRMQIALEHAGKDAGVTVADIDLAFASDILDGIAAGSDMSAYVTTKDGRLVGHVDRGVLAGAAELGTLPQVAALAGSGRAGAIGRARSGESVLVAAAAIPRLGWYVLVERPLAEAYRGLGALALRLSGFFGLGLVLCVAAGMLLARRMTVPIEALQAGASRLAAGDFDQTISVGTGDEIERLADEFNHMAGQLRALYAGLEQKVADRTKDLAQSVRELTALEEVGRALAASLELGNVFSTILGRAVTLAEADGGAVYGFDRARRTFSLAGAHGLDPGLVAALRGVEAIRLDGLLGEVATHGRTVQIPEIAEAPGFPLQEATLAAGFRAALVAPLVGPEGVLGALVVASRRPGRTSAAKVRLIQTFAHQSALAMHNAQLFQEVQDKGRELAIASEHKSRFFAIMSHELRTPLGAILGFAELLADGLYGELPEKAKQVLERVHVNGIHLLGLIDDVLDMSKLEAGELALVLDDYSMRNVIDHVASTTFALAHGKGLELRREVDGELPRGHGDERRLTQVLLNIVGNAIKFTDTGHVAIKARARRSRFEIVVEDTGPGIAPEDRACVFEAFQQGDNTSTRLKGGTGLGLSISRRFVEMHGGTIDLSSTLGVGSTFTIIVPVDVRMGKSAADSCRDSPERARP
jgi:signal transduction histidine kinase